MFRYLLWRYLLYKNRGERRTGEGDNRGRLEREVRKGGEKGRRERGVREVSLTVRRPGRRTTSLRFDLDDGRPYSASTMTTDDFSLRWPGWQVVTVPCCPVRRKIFAQNLVISMRQLGQRMTLLRVAPDDGRPHSPQSGSAWNDLKTSKPRPCAMKGLEKVDTTGH